MGDRTREALKSKESSQAGGTTRRDVLRVAAGLGAFGFPTIVSPRVFGRSAPSERIQVAQIGCGRIARSSEIPGMFRNSDHARIVAACDLDSVRLADAQELIERGLSTRGGGSIKTYANYKEMLKDPAIDAVCISTPDHWHAQPAIDAVLAGKDVYLQKPTSLTIREGRQLADAVAKTGRILQIGSQQRSEAQFIRACELVRNGKIGKIKRIEVGLPTDPPGGDPTPTNPPPNLDYDAWIGSTPMVPYAEDGVHPQTDDPKKRYGRPGWLRREQFGAGMITGWGAHHLDIAQWGLGVEHSGPVEIEATAEFPKPGSGLWNVHGPYHVEAKYADGALLVVDDKLPIGVKFIGEDGWIWVSRGAYPPKPGAKGTKSLDASDPRLLDPNEPAGPIRLHASPKNDHHLDWLTSIKSREAPAAPAEVGHRSTSTCLLAHIAMKAGRPLRWNPEAERFVDDPESDAHLSRPQRAPYGTGA